MHSWAGMMVKSDPKNKNSAFHGRGFTKSISEMKQEIQELYLADEVPWVIGYSGGKDSTAVLQLTWLALSELDSRKSKKPVYVITTDTLVENPVVAAWASQSHDAMRKTAQKENLPIRPHMLKPEIRDSFWVNLIGKGYPAPRHKFRWCTERLKIKPSTTFIQNTVNQHGEVILLIGARKAESAARAHSIEKRKEGSPKERLTPHVELFNCLVYTPIEDWTNDDVWTFLMRIPNKWGASHKDLLAMYRGASADNECPLVVDTSTPSCGNSRFGCWVCTLVEEDKSMTAMIQNDEEQEWMLPLLELRNDLDFRTDEARKQDRYRRDFRRMSGHLTHYKNKDGEFALVPGPYTQKSRIMWLTQLLEIQQLIRDNDTAPDSVRNIELISLEELQEIRRIWVVEKHEIEDYIPAIYEEIVGEPYPGLPIDENLIFDQQSLDLLKEVCEGDDLRYELLRNLLDIERKYRTKGSRHGLFKDLEDTVTRSYFENEADATMWAKRKAMLKEMVFVSSDGSEIDHDGLQPNLFSPVIDSDNDTENQA